MNLTPKPIVLHGVDFQVIPHEQQMYPTCGDYWWDDPLTDTGVLHVRVSRMKEWRHVALVFVHEVVEALLLKTAGVREVEVKAFDQQFERERAEGKHGDKEPGDDPSAPYRRQHQLATLIERTFAWMLDVDWDNYDNEVVTL